MITHTNPSQQVLVSLFSLVNQLLTAHAWTFASSPATVKAPFFISHLKPSKKNSITLTYLEINGWLLSLEGITMLVDPLLEGSLDFGIPDLYKGCKRVVPTTGITESLPPIDCVLLTQGLDDHAHVRTLKKLQRLDPDIPILAPPSAKGALETSGFSNFKESSSTVQFLKHGEEATITPRNPSKANQESSLRIRATKGALVGPPWQKRQNGYILRGNRSTSPSLYIEPHVEFNSQELAQLGPVDVVISPISGQALPAFELVHGPKATLRLVETLKPKYLVPMQNGDIDVEGAVSKLVSEVGSAEEFREKMAASQLGTKLVEVTPGKDFVISLHSR